MAYRKKLIDVSLPLEAINQATIREKAIRHGHPSTLHLWWSRKPLAACRAILFASLVDDPSEHKEIFPSEEAQEQERQRLFRIIEDLIKWESSQSKDVLTKARDEIHTSKDILIPPIRDPFCGGGSIPLEAQRLGLQARSSDLNPVAVLITKALIDIPPTFAGRPPVAPDPQQPLVPGDREGARGLAYDIRYYGQWMREEAERRIGHLYPKVTLPSEYGSGEATVIAWLWVRTVPCPNPACGAQMPLVNNWWLSKKKGRQAWIEPVLEAKGRRLFFEVKKGFFSEDQARKIDNGSCFINAQGKKAKASFICLFCHDGIAKGGYIDEAANQERMGYQPLAIVADSHQGKVYIPFCKTSLEAVDHLVEEIFSSNAIQQKLPNEPAHGTFASNAQGRTYGFKKFSDYFMHRQLVALSTFSDLVQEARQRVLLDAQQASFPDDDCPLHKRGMGAVAYADAVATYLAIAVDRLADRNSSICSWDVGYVKVRNTFARQAISMTWDFAEANPFSESTGNFIGAVDWVAEVIEAVPCGQHCESNLGTILEDKQEFPSNNLSEVYQRDATVTINGITNAVIVTDPPYYDNISYADLSDFFYVWLRRSLKDIYPDLFATVLTPKDNELVATPFRFEGNKQKARAFFEEHLSDIFRKMYKLQSKEYPMLLYYGFKQTEMENEHGDDALSTRMIASTGWETMLTSLIQEGFTITGTWPMRTEMLNRSVGLGTNALASSIVLVCRPRPKNAGIASRRQFLKELRGELPPALKKLQHDDIAPVDLAQACVGPGMAIYSRYHKVVEADGTPLRVRAALQLINRALDEILSEHDGEYDAETRWAIAWFEQHAMEPGAYGSAETLSKAKNISVESLKKKGWLESEAGKVRLRRRDELNAHGFSRLAATVTLWEIMQRIIYVLSEHGEKQAAIILRDAGERGEVARDLAYRLYTLCERKGWTQEALVYNGLVTSWSEMSRYAQDEHIAVKQGILELENS